MDPARLRELLVSIQDGSKSIEDAMTALRDLPFADLGFAKVDHHRAMRQGYPEVVFAQGKTSLQVINIVKEIHTRGQTVLVTRLTPEHGKLLTAAVSDVSYDATSRTATSNRVTQKTGRGKIAIVSAGTADLPVAEEAAVTASVFGNEVERIVDVGVAGLHRLFAHIDRIRQASAIVVVAGMEGALPSVVAGLVAKPIIAVPTSVGYGASFGGLAALLGMLNSCGSGVTVVNIDNGFGAGYTASLINRREDA